MQALKDHKNPGGIVGLDSDAVIAHGKAPLAGFLLDRHVNAGRFRAVKFQGISDQVLENLAQLRRVDRDRGQRIVAYDRVRLFDRNL